MRTVPLELCRFNRRPYPGVMQPLDIPSEHVTFQASIVARSSLTGRFTVTRADNTEDDKNDDPPSSLTERAKDVLTWVAVAKMIIEALERFMDLFSLRSPLASQMALSAHLGPDESGESGPGAYDEDRRGDPDGGLARRSGLAPTRRSHRLRRAGSRPEGSPEHCSLAYARSLPRHQTCRRTC